LKRSLFLIIFMWTPPHFWALALFKMGDYETAGVPMLPNVAGADATRAQIWNIYPDAGRDRTPPQALAGAGAHSGRTGRHRFRHDNRAPGWRQTAWSELSDVRQHIR
jgi:hypothetical protein